jgi:hypothetical protein
MWRISIQQFRAALADTANQGGPLRAYRAITRHPATEARVVGDWPTWPPVAAAAGWYPWQDGAAARA